MEKSKLPTENQVISAIKVALSYQHISVFNTGSDKWPYVDIRVVSSVFNEKSREEREQIIWQALERSIKDVRNRNVIKPSFMLLTPAELDDAMLELVHLHRIGDLCKCNLS